jgi:hypothetical protein
MATVTITIKDTADDGIEMKMTSKPAHKAGSELTPAQTFGALGAMVIKNAIDDDEFFEAIDDLLDPESGKD